MAVKQTHEKFGNLKGPGPGRPKGIPNKNTGLIREMIAQALDEAGGVQYLLECAHDPKTKSAFLGLIGKVMPVQVIGDKDNPLQHNFTISFKAPSGS